MAHEPLQVSSVGGRVGGTPGLAAYPTAKFAVEGFYYDASPDFANTPIANLLDPKKH
jgi:NAD(P)-dependent dehydrogenase (short-subunit alcohol dehydrogenase family)